MGGGVAWTVTVGGGGAAATVVVTGGDGTGCGRALFVPCLPKSVDTNRSSAAVMATTSAARPAQTIRPCQLVGISLVSSSTDHASPGSLLGGGGTWAVSASAPCSDAAVSSVLTGVTLRPLTRAVQDAANAVNPRRAMFAIRLRSDGLLRRAATRRCGIIRT